MSNKVELLNKYVTCNVELFKLAELIEFYQEYDISVSLQFKDKIEERATAVHAEALALAAALGIGICE